MALPFLNTKVKDLLRKLKPCGQCYLTPVLVNLLWVLAVTCPNTEMGERRVHRSSLSGLGQAAASLPVWVRWCHLSLKLGEPVQAQVDVSSRLFLPWTLNISSGKIFLVVKQLRCACAWKVAESQRNTEFWMLHFSRSYQHRRVGLGKRMFLLPRIHVPAESYVVESGCQRTTESLLGDWSYW